MEDVQWDALEDKDLQEQIVLLTNDVDNFLYDKEDADVLAPRDSDSARVGALFTLSTWSDEGTRLLNELESAIEVFDQRRLAADWQDWELEGHYGERLEGDRGRLQDFVDRVDDGVQFLIQRLQHAAYDVNAIEGVED